MIFIEGIRTGKTALLKVQSDIIEAKQDYYNKTGYMPNEIRMNYNNYEFIGDYYSSLVELKKWKDLKEIERAEPYILGMKIVLDDSIEGFEVR